MTLTPGTVVGGYRIEKVLGAGGMGTVYLAEHPSLPRMDAIKVLSAEHTADAEFRARFEREASLAAGLDHPNIVSVYNRGEENGQLWIAMQYVRGVDAAAENSADRHGMHPLRALHIITEVGKALDYAHRKGLLHRDIKPANFLLTAEGEEERVLLADFGVAKSFDDASELTQTGTFLATIAYASPEQLAGQQLDSRSDIYSLACSLYKLLTGQAPFPSNQPAVTMMGHLQQPPPRATAIRHGLPPAIDEVLAIALAKHPDDRFTSCRAFTDAAAEALKSGHAPIRTNTSPTYPIMTFAPQPARPVLPEPTGKVVRGHHSRWIAAAAVLVLALVAGVGIWAATRSDSAATAAPTTAAEVAKGDVRKENPQFLGKRLTMVDVTDAQSAMYLTPSPPTGFLEGLGFAYNPVLAIRGTEPAVRPLSSSSIYTAFKDLGAGYILAIRSDTNAGAGSLRGLPPAMLDTPATVIAVDDPKIVDALRNWSPDSERVLLEKLVPLLAAAVR